MIEATRERLFGYGHAFEQPVTAWTVGLIGALLAAAPVAAWLLRRGGRLDAKLYGEILLRWSSWLWLALLMLAPILLGAAWVVAAATLLGLLCYGEFSRATGVFREKAVSLIVVFAVSAFARDALVRKHQRAPTIGSP